MSLPHTSSRTNSRGLTLLEVVIAVSILSLLTLLIYGAFSNLTRSKSKAAELAERHRLGRQVMTRMSRELSEAYLSLHVAPTTNLITRVTAFMGSSKRVDFNAFAHRRIMRDAHESDQCEISYFVASSRSKPNQLDLVRREQSIIDEYPGKGGVVQVLVDNIESFSLRYLDPMTGLWTETWDSTQMSGNLNRLPLQVELSLVLRGGPASEAIRLKTKTQLMILQPLSFAIR